MPARIDLDPVEVENVYKETGSYVTTSEHFGVSTGPIKRILNSLGYKLSRRRYSTDEHFFDVIDTEEKAYWLGYLAADGTIRYRHHERLNGRLRGSSINLKLGTMDIEHLKKFKDLVSPDTPLKYMSSNVPTKSGELSSTFVVLLAFNSNHMVEQIMDKGVGPRKTFTIGRPNISDEFIPHYIRGLFDGDGCCQISKTIKSQKKSRYVNLVRYSIATASEEMNKFLHEELSKTGVETKRSGITTYISKIDNAIRFYHYLYDNATIYLERKKTLGDLFIQEHESIVQWEKENGRVYSLKTNIWTIPEVNILVSEHSKGTSISNMLEKLNNRTKPQIQGKIYKLKKSGVI
jgi:hypothetical protein